MIRVEPRPVICYAVDMAGKLVAAKGKRERRKVDWGELLDVAWGREARQEGEDWERSERLTATRARGYIEEEKENRAPSTKNEEGSEGERRAKSSLGGVCVLSPLLFSQCSARESSERESGGRGREVEEDEGEEVLKNGEREDVEKEEEKEEQEEQNNEKEGGESTAVSITAKTVSKCLQTVATDNHSNSDNISSGAGDVINVSGNHCVCVSGALPVAIKTRREEEANIIWGGNGEERKEQREEGKEKEEGGIKENDEEKKREEEKDISKRSLSPFMHNSSPSSSSSLSSSSSSILSPTKCRSVLTQMKLISFLSHSSVCTPSSSPSSSSTNIPSKITTPTISSDSLLHVPIPNQDVHYYSTPSHSPRVMTFGGRGRKLFQ